MDLELIKLNSGIVVIKIGEEIYNLDGTASKLILGYDSNSDGIFDQERTTVSFSRAEKLATSVSDRGFKELIIAVPFKEITIDFRSPWVNSIPLSQMETYIRERYLLVTTYMELEDSRAFKL